MSIFGVGPWANNPTQPLGQGFTAGPYRVRYYTHVQGYGDYTPIKQQRHALLLRPRAFAAGRHMHSVSDVFQGSAAVVYKATVPSQAFCSRRLIARAAGRVSKYPTGVLSGPYLCSKLTRAGRGMTADQQKKKLGEWLSAIVAGSVVLGFFGLAAWGFIEAMMTPEFWIKAALVLVFGVASLLCFVISVQAERAGNKRKSAIFLAVCTAILITAFLIGMYFGIIPTDAN